MNNCKNLQNNLSNLYILDLVKFQKFYEDCKMSNVQKTENFHGILQLQLKHLLMNLILEEYDKNLIFEYLYKMKVE